jgi:hypothetical protein
VSCGDHIFSSCLQYERFDVDEEINDMMNGIPQDEFDGYRCNISNDSINDGTMRKGFYDSMSEGWNEEGNGKEEQERATNENGGRNFLIMPRGRYAYEVWNVSLWMMLGCSLQMAM